MDGLGKLMIERAKTGSPLSRDRSLQGPPSFIPLDVTHKCHFLKSLKRSIRFGHIWIWSISLFLWRTNISSRFQPYFRFSHSYIHLYFFILGYSIFISRPKTSLQFSKMASAKVWKRFERCRRIRIHWWMVHYYFCFWFGGYNWNYTQGKLWFSPGKVGCVLWLIKVDAQTKAYAGLDAFQNSCAFLGIGCLLCYCGILRYLGYFQGYNILVLTISSAMPNVLKFLSCALTLYTGYVLCGWLVLGPFNDKFRTLTVTSETLFSLLNGDDMFNTFQMLEPRNNFNLIRPTYSLKNWPRNFQTLGEVINCIQGTICIFTNLSLFIYLRFYLCCFIPLYLSCYGFIWNYQRIGINAFQHIFISNLLSKNVWIYLYLEKLIRENDFIQPV